MRKGIIFFAIGGGVGLAISLGFLNFPTADDDANEFIVQPPTTYIYSNPRPCGLDWREVGCIIRSEWGDLEVEPDTWHTELECWNFEYEQAAQCWCKLASVTLPSFKEDCIQSSPCDLRRHLALWREPSCSDSEECLAYDQHILHQDIQCWGEFSFRGGSP